MLHRRFDGIVAVGSLSDNSRSRHRLQETPRGLGSALVIYEDSSDDFLHDRIARWRSRRSLPGRS